MYYIFDVDTFVESSLHDGDTPQEVTENLKWARKIDGKLVDMTKELWGICKGYKVAAEWCRQADHIMKFDKELYLKDSMFRDKWCEEIDGEIVGFEKSNDTHGFCKGYIIPEDWCNYII